MSRPWVAAARGLAGPGLTQMVGQELSGQRTLSFSDMKPCGSCTELFTKEEDRIGHPNTPSNHSHRLPCTKSHTYLAINTQTHRLTEPSTAMTIAQHSSKRTSPAPERRNGPDLIGSQHGGAISLQGDASPSWIVE